MDRPTCKTCPFWDSGGRRGLCRNTRPQVVAYVAPPLRSYEDPAVEFETRWPSTDGDESCGEHPEFPYYAAAFKQAMKDAATNREGAEEPRVIIAPADEDGPGYTPEQEAAFKKLWDKMGSPYPDPK